MARMPIAIDRLKVRATQIWDERWFLLTAGDFREGRFNTMTVSWGSIGTMWNKPFAQVVVRPGRHTHGFMESYPTFTLCSFPPARREALTHLGTRSGRDGDKIAGSGLTPVASRIVAAPCFDEADLVIECRKIYWDDFEPSHFLDPSIEQEYPAKDYHRIYFGEIVAVDTETDGIG